MSGLDLSPVPDNSGAALNDDHLEHYYCACDEDLALCGSDLSGAYTVPEIDWDDDDLCLVCMDLFDKPCVRCKE